MQLGVVLALELPSLRTFKVTVAWGLKSGHNPYRYVAPSIAHGAQRHDQQALENGLLDKKSIVGRAAHGDS